MGIDIQTIQNAYDKILSRDAAKTDKIWYFLF